MGSKEVILIIFYLLLLNTSQEKKNADIALEIYNRSFLLPKSVHILFFICLENGLLWKQRRSKQISVCVLLIKI